jgi:hypothetical protein
MRKNYSDLIKDKNKRLLTAKAYKFQWQCIELIAKTKNINYCRFSPQIKELKVKFTNIFLHLVIDKELTLKEIKELIKNKTLLVENK